MSITFKGVYEISLGGFPCIRGYATLRDIARCSYPDPAYQRELTPEHVEEIKDFFAADKYLFFPEVILSTTLEADYEKAGAPLDDPLQTVMKGHKFASNVNGLRIMPRTHRYDIVVPDDARLFKRIDGNHRLSALEAYVATAPIVDFDTIVNNFVVNYQRLILHICNTRTESTR